MIQLVLIGWIPIVALLFRVLGPRRAILVAVLGGHVFLPDLKFDLPSPLSFPFGKPDSIGAGLALGLLLFETRTLLRARPRWFDLPMLAVVMCPLIGIVTGGPVVYRDVADIFVERVLGWLLPYVAARLYFSDEEGVARIAVGIVVSTLALVPVGVYEAVMGPHWYVMGLIFDATYAAGSVGRLGGWRPEGFFNNGIYFATCMALGAVTAFWLWIGRGWRPRWGPSWWPTLVLVLATVGCRGVYGYITLALGLIAAVLTQTLRTRIILVAIALITPTYITVRVTGLWDARKLVALAELAGRMGTVNYRLMVEDDVMAAVFHKNPAFGFGNRYWHAQDVGVTMIRGADAWWVYRIWEGGLVDVTLGLLALYLVPGFLALTRVRGRPSRQDARSPTWGLVLFLFLHMTDGAQNHSPANPVVLIAGALVGLSLVRSPSRPIDRQFTNSRRDASRPSAANPLGRNALRLAAVLLFLATPEIIDTATRLWARE
jgi:hypothetical protein